MDGLYNGALASKMLALQGFRNSCQTSKGWFVIWDSVDSFTEKQYGLPPAQLIYPDQLNRI